MPQNHRAALTASEPCRPEALGGQVSQCPDGPDLAYRYHSCKHRHCPKCQNDEALRGLHTQRALLLPVPDGLLTCTRPTELRPVARSPPQRMYNLWLRLSAAALQDLALDPQHLGGQIGMVGVLHPWTRDMASPPHVPSLVPPGALSPDESTWLVPR